MGKEGRGVEWGERGEEREGERERVRDRQTERKERERERERLCVCVCLVMFLVEEVMCVKGGWPAQTLYRQ